ncbi:MAG: VIT and VWA domain-containing protein [Deltaproteobacteria bacterium]|nr:VIT and VWA domain-containing protein [Deltaproteobacteria bacterium]
MSLRDIRTGKEMSLQSVALEGKLTGLFLEMKIRQAYLNRTGSLLEVSYTFPLSWGAELMGLKAYINGRERAGEVFPKREAERKYEKAIDEGDAPVLVSESAPGLYTANLGNVKPGDEVRVECSYVQLLRFDNGQVRLTVPAAVAPRYGDMRSQGGLRPHESAEADPQAGYPLSVRVDVMGDMAKSRISAPNHSALMTPLDGGLRVATRRGALLDRDFVLVLEDVKVPDKSFALFASDPADGSCAVLASFCPCIPAESSPLSLKILVDCSGSMEGRSIEQAKKALARIVERLTAKDYVSYSVFGTGVIHRTRKLVPCDSKNIRLLLGYLAETEADMGGTEMAGALAGTLALDRPQDGAPENAALLLITDCEVWDLAGALAAVKGSGHRVFTVGVGFAPVESHLRLMAEETGGAAELAGPEEDVSAAIDRVFRRLHGSPVTGSGVDWGAEPLWASKAPEAFFDGETTHVFASFPQKPQSPPRLFWETAKGPGECSAMSMPETGLSCLPRLLGSARVKEMLKAADSSRFGADKETAERATELAVRYQLVTPMTSMFLVSERGKGEKAEGIPRLRNVPQMRAYGWAGSDFDGLIACCRETDPVAMESEVPAGIARIQEKQSIIGHPKQRGPGSKKPALKPFRDDEPTMPSDRTFELLYLSIDEYSQILEEHPALCDGMLELAEGAAAAFARAGAEAAEIPQALELACAAVKASLPDTGCRTALEAVAARLQRAINGGKAGKAPVPREAWALMILIACRALGKRAKGADPAFMRSLEAFISAAIRDIREFRRLWKTDFPKILRAAGKSKGVSAIKG